MSKIREYNVRDMFNYWVRNQKHEKPYLVLKYPSRAKNSELWYNVRSEIEHLETKLLTLDARIFELEQKDNSISRFTPATIEIFENKKEIYDIQERLKELRKESPDTNKKLMDFYTFRDVIYTYNEKAIEAIIDGEVVNLSEKLGFMYVLKINNRTKNINWQESLQYKEELLGQGETPKDKDNPDGQNWLIYYDNPWYLRWAWKKKKGACRVKNHTVYAFYPSATSSKGVPGTKRKLVEANENNPLLHLKYIHT